VKSKLPPAVRRFLSDHLLGYATKGYRITLHPGEKITAPGMTYTGEATAEKLEIAIGGELESWLGILVHETCHLDQHQEDPTTFNRADTALVRISSWLDRSTDDLNPPDFRTILELESDCERRTVEKIARFALPLDPEDYTRRANAYLLSYGVALRHRTWIPQPYRDDTLCKKMTSLKILGVDEALAPSLVSPDADFLRLATPPPATKELPLPSAPPPRQSEAPNREVQTRL
jgi:hypothetical protein